ncbi:MAG TPA: glycohydrolase toxin TNT-related protein [Thermomonospora sp.]|nr:glycohydrolase toxin TNT-related protein [Thermomonospora sp.]
MPLSRIGTEDPLVDREPQSLHELVALLAPESPLLFAHARRVLGRSVPEAAGRLGIGEVVPGGWSVLRGSAGWVVLRDEHVTEFGDAASAVVRATAAVMAEAGRRVDTGLLQTVGLLETGFAFDADTPRAFWSLTGAARESGPHVPGEVFVRLDTLADKPPLFSVLPFVAPSGNKGVYVSTREVFERLLRAQLPPTVDHPGKDDHGALTLPEGTEVDSYGDLDQVMVYEPGTPFSRRASWGSPAYHRHHVYRVERPLRVYPAFWFATPAQPTMEEQDRDGMGYYLVDTIADLLRSGALSEPRPLGKGRWRTAWR